MQRLKTSANAVEMIDEHDIVGFYRHTMLTDLVTVGRKESKIDGVDFPDFSKPFLVQGKDNINELARWLVGLEEGSLPAEELGIGELRQDNQSTVRKAVVYGPSMGVYIDLDPETFDAEAQAEADRLEVAAHPTKLDETVANAGFSEPAGHAGLYLRHLRDELVVRPGGGYPIPIYLAKQLGEWIVEGTSVLGSAY